VKKYFHDWLTSSQRIGSSIGGSSRESYLDVHTIIFPCYRILKCHFSKYCQIPPSTLLKSPPPPLTETFFKTSSHTTLKARNNPKLTFVVRFYDIGDWSATFICFGSNHSKIISFYWTCGAHKKDANTHEISS
jgi:hypothetical protein